MSRGERTSWRRVLLGRGGARPSSPRVACHAPFTSMYLDQLGNVRACCQNVYQIMGNVAEQRLFDIWNGDQNRDLRRALEADDYSVGCDFCAWQVEDGRPDLAFARWYDERPFAEPDPAWPSQLELSISNTCNLQCEMCNGEWSSSIRSQREGLPPLPKVYGDSFFDDLRAFVPHLRSVKFLGGEPFLAGETLRVMDLLVEMGARPKCHVTTNGTQWSPRVERILDMLPIDVAVSVDAATRETYEAIRVGASWDTLQRNLDRFQERAAVNGTDVTVTFCMMTSNWHELAGFCHEADRRGIGSTVNLVTQPDHLTLYRLPPAELERVLAELETTDRRDAGTFTLSGRTWTGELDRLRRHLEERRAGRLVTGLDIRKAPDHAEPFERTDQVRRAASIDAIKAERQELLGRWVGVDAGRLHVDPDDVVTGIEPDGPILDLLADEIVGRNVAELIDVFSRHHGTIDRIDTLVEADHGRTHVFEAGFADGRAVRVLSIPAIHDDGSSTGTWVYLAWRVDVGADA